MNVEYCTKCGYKNTYSVQAPNFCGGCGSPLKEDISVASAPPVSNAQVAINDQEAEEKIPSISKLSYEIHSEGNQKLNIADLIKQGPSEGGKVRRAGAANRLKNRQEVLEEGLRSCKSAKTQPPEDVQG